jgi:hypothetical protein
MKRIELQNLAVRFRVNCRNLRSEFDAISSVGGAIAIHYGRWIEMPERNRWKRAQIRNQIADLLDKKAEGKA